VPIVFARLNEISQVVGTVLSLDITTWEAAGILTTTYVDIRTEAKAVVEILIQIKLPRCCKRRTKLIRVLTGFSTTIRKDD
jgi:hypothetical protein